MKYLEFKDGNFKYQIPVTDVAEEITNYYSEVDGIKKHSFEWNKMYTAYRDDVDELMDWVMNNSNPTDWKNIIITQIDVEYPKHFEDCDDFKIVEN